VTENPSKRKAKNGMQSILLLLGRGEIIPRNEHRMSKEDVMEYEHYWRQGINKRMVSGAVQF